MNETLYITSLRMGAGLKYGIDYFDELLIKNTKQIESTNNSLHTNYFNKSMEDSRIPYLINTPSDIDIYDVNIFKKNMSKKVSKKDLKLIMKNYEVEKIYYTFKERTNNEEEMLRLFSDVELLKERGLINYQIFFDFDLKNCRDKKDFNGIKNFFSNNFEERTCGDKEYLVLKLTLK